jgi:hypothetical protein
MRDPNKTLFALVLLGSLAGFCVEPPFRLLGTSPDAIREVVAS